jgi:hypothetical protein
MVPIQHYPAFLSVFYDYHPDGSKGADILLRKMQKNKGAKRTSYASESLSYTPEL